MFKLYDAFAAVDSNKHPYSISFERHTETANMHAEPQFVCDRPLCLYR